MINLFKIVILIKASNVRTQDVYPPSRRIYIGNLHPDTNEHELKNFLNDQIKKYKLTKQDGDSLISVRIKNSFSKYFGFLIFRSDEETTAALSLDGIDYKKRSIVFSRDKYYTPDKNKETEISKIPGIVSTYVEDSNFKIYVGGIPTYLEEDEIKEKLSIFGTLKSFRLIRDYETDISKGFAFCEYLNSNVTSFAIEGISGMQLGDQKLNARLSSKFFF